MEDKEMKEKLVDFEKSIDKSFNDETLDEAIKELKKHVGIWGDDARFFLADAYLRRFEKNGEQADLLESINLFEYLSKVYAKFLEKKVDALKKLLK